MFTDQDKKILQVLKTTILQYYNKKMNELKDPKITSLFYDNCIITGGAISSLFHSEIPKDIDVYAKDPKSIKVISDLLTEIGEVIKTTETYSLDAAASTDKLITNNAITLKNDVQFVKLGVAEVCRKNFDFIHCMPYLDIKTQKLYISKSQLESIRNKQLVPNIGGEKIKPHRVLKYTDKGWKTWETSQTTSIASATSTPMTWVTDSKAFGTGFPGVVAQEMTALYPQIAVLK